jgi:ubiquitin-protein ligase
MSVLLLVLFVLIFSKTNGRHRLDKTIEISICENRAAAMTIRTVLLSLQALLATPEPDDPQDAVVANQYKKDRKLFEKTARHWANVYANGR